MILSTYSVKPIEFKAVDSQERGSKPLGLWFAPEELDYFDDEAPVQNAWKTWCEAERYAPYAYKHKFVINNLPFCSLEKLDPRKVLHLTTEKEVKTFAYRYGTPDGYGVDWNTLATQVAGIMISPYQYELRHHPLTRWYYGWDLSSGCIWRLPDGVTVTEVELDWDSSGLVPTRRYL